MLRRFLRLGRRLRGGLSCLGDFSRGFGLCFGGALGSGGFRLTCLLYQFFLLRLRSLQLRHQRFVPALGIGKSRLGEVRPVLFGLRLILCRLVFDGQPLLEGHKVADSPLGVLASEILPERIFLLYELRQSHVCFLFSIHFSAPGAVRGRRPVTFCHRKYVRSALSSEISTIVIRNGMSITDSSNQPNLSHTDATGVITGSVTPTRKL